jgi:hypothetical protein
MIRMMAVAAIVMAATPALADQCSGTLRRVEGDLILANKPEGECIIAKADEKRVLRHCLFEKHCAVSGRIQLCSDVGIMAGECVFVDHVTAATRMKGK